jgi:hypothetical protein
MVYGKRLWRFHAYHDVPTIRNYVYQVRNDNMQVFLGYIVLYKSLIICVGKYVCPLWL